jgi:hypothetical protein
LEFLISFSQSKYTVLLEGNYSLFVNQFIYKEIANSRHYILLAVAILLVTSFSVNNSIISTYGQQSTANKSAVQIDPGLDSSESGQPLTFGPSANDLDTLKEQQSSTDAVESKENAAQIQNKQGTDEEIFRNLLKADDNDISTEPQSEKPLNKDEQNREGQQEFGEDEGNKADSGEDEGNKADSGEDEGNKADSGEDEGNKADSGENESEKENDDDIPFELPFP